MVSLCINCAKNSFDEQSEKNKMEKQEQYDEINNPEHYQGDGMTAYDVIKAFKFGYELGNAFKYMARCEKKGNKKKDLLKCIKNVQFEIEKMD